MTWDLFVPGDPKTTQTGSIVRLPDGRAFPRRRHTEWSNRIALAAAATRPPVLFTGPLRVTLEFSRRRPGSLPKRITAPVQRPDLGNLSKGLLDALGGVVYADDAQVVELIERKRFAGPGMAPGVAIRVETL